MENLQPSSAPTIGELTTEARASFYRKTYMHVALAVLMFVVVEAIFFQIPALLEFALSLTQGWTWLMLLGGFCLLPIMLKKWP